MTKPLYVKFTTIIAILFACSAIPAFANRGGGGGGSHGGGGFHGGGGGGFRSSGGGGFRGGSYAPPAAGYGGMRGGAASPQRYGGGYAARPGSNYSRPGNNFAGGSQRSSNSSASRPAIADGQWHSFGSASGSRGPAGAPSGSASASSGGGFHTFGGTRAAGTAGSARSFSGQGHEVYEEAPSARNVVPRSQSLSTIHNSFSGSSAASLGARSNSSLYASSSFGGGSGFLGNRSFAGSSGFAGRGQFGNSWRGRPYGFGRGCWGCGYGFGFGGWGWGGWGFGWPWLGFGLWDPFWYDPWWGYGPAYGYGYYGYPDNSVYGYPDSGYYAPDDNSNPPPDQGEQYEQYGPDTSNGNWVTPNGPSPSTAQNSGTLAVPVLIYLKNGAVRSVRDYWIVDGELHYILMNGVQSSVNLDQVDLPRTNTENAKSGVRFIFKSEPSVPPSAPDGSVAPPASSEPPQSPAPTQQINAVPQPEART